MHHRTLLWHAMPYQTEHAGNGTGRTGAGRCIAVVVLAAVLVVPATTAVASATTTAGPARPSGPAADLSTGLTGGRGSAYLGEAVPPALARDGYVQREYEAAGTATSYTATAPLGGDGRWAFAPDTTAPYRTRVLVRAPARASRFSGTVVVEWLNVSGGIDADPEWVSTAEEIVRAGDAWVGVSAQRIGVEGGPVLTKVENIPGAEDQGKGLKVV